MNNKVHLLVLWSIGAGLWLFLWASNTSRTSSVYVLKDSVATLLDSISMDTSTCATSSDIDQKDEIEEPVAERVSETLECIDINTATPSELMKIPGIGPVIAMRIVEYREKHDGFSKSDELIKVKGIGPVKLGKMQNVICLQ